LKDLSTLVIIHKCVRAHIYTHMHAHTWYTTCNFWK